MAKPLTEEQKQRRAETARTNGRRSKGPVSAAGKHRSSMNAISVGKFVAVHEENLPPFVSLLSARDRKAYVQLYQKNLRDFQPKSENELWLVRSLSAEQLQHDRYCRMEALAFGADLNYVLDQEENLSPDALELAAFERHASGVRTVRLLERKQKQHLAAAERLVRLLLRLQKVDRPITQNEPIVDIPDTPVHAVEKEPVTQKYCGVSPDLECFLLTDLPESVTFNQQQKRNSRV